MITMKKWQNVNKLSKYTNLTKEKNKIDNNNELQIDINMNVSEQINNVIMETDKNTQSNHITIYISPINAMTILYDTITYINSEYIW